MPNSVSLRGLTKSLSSTHDPDGLAVDGNGSLENGRIPGRVARYTFLGRAVRLEIALPDGTLLTAAVPGPEAGTYRLGSGKSGAVTADSSRAFQTNGHV